MNKTALNRKVDKIVKNARNDSYKMADVSVKGVNNALRKMANILQSEKERLKKENLKDIKEAKERGLSEAMVDRLTLNDKRIKSMIKGLREVAALKSPVGEVFDKRVRPNKLKISKIRVPVGVILIIYESRPNVTVDAAAVCLKSQNAVILRGGSEAFNSNRILVELFSRALRQTGLPSNAVQFVPTTDREAVNILLKKDEEVDLVIPRGGETLIRTVVENSRIPVIKHYKGICHIYVSKNADMKKALPIVVNAKTQRPGVCNALETLLIDKKMTKGNKENIIKSLKEAGVVLYGDDSIRALDRGIRKATKKDWKAEYLDLRLAVKEVDGVEAAVEHINTYGSHHTDAILSGSKKEISVFLKKVDSSSVISNASTRFSDGGEYGMGCEIGISTDKLHSRGPMGTQDLTTYKWVVEGKGQVRD